MAAEGRRDRRDGPPPVRDRRSPPPFDRGSSAGYPPLPPAAVTRDRSPVRDPYIDRYRDPFRDGRYPPREPLAPRAPRDPLLPRRDDPYYDDPYRRPPPADPYYDRYRDDPYRRDPYADPYPREPYPSTYRDPVLPPLKTECMIVLMNSTLRQYGLSIEARLKQFGVVTDITVIPEDRTLQQQIEEISRRGGIFAIIVNSQNEVHRSITLNILYGTPQEHRNMPFEDALTLISSSFKKYLQNMREKEVAAAPVVVVEKDSAATIVKAFLPPSKDVSYLLNLLADNRPLTVEELDKVIFYLRERRDKILEAEGRPKVATEAVSAYGDVRPNESAIQQQELQSKILSMLNQNGTGSVSVASVRPSMGTVQSPQAVAGIVQSPVQTATSQSNATLINFDNPSVQKALDNLIQSGPNLLRNISGSSQGQPPVGTSSQSLTSSRPGSGGLVSAYNQGYGAPPSRPSLLPPQQSMPRY
ncbi:nuclear receptor coactivator 5-like isoform X2 [Gigantopelta aegis]|nr:nuclear receptor coactivator 5-like isoform X2 [Gigantopelta aegis]